MRRKEMNNLLEERAERILVLEQRMENMNQQIEGYRAREQSIVESLTTAQIESKQRVEAAQARANELLAAAQAQSSGMLSEAQSQVSGMLSEAQSQATALIAQSQSQANDMLAAARADAERILSSAKAESAGILAQSRQSAAEYEQTSAHLRALLTQTAAQARDSAEQFAAIIERCGSQPTETDESVAQPVAPTQTVVADLPDAEGDPAKLMQNIYTLQNRDLPESVRTHADSEDATADCAAAFEPGADAATQEPYDFCATEQEEIPDLGPRPETEWQPEGAAGPADEWQPEVEEEMEDIPTVSELMPDLPNVSDDELSLDALLDEIIKAGE